MEGELEHVRQLLSLHTGAFVDEQLMPYFGPMVTIVKRSEQTKDIEQFEKGNITKLNLTRLPFEKRRLTTFIRRIAACMPSLCAKLAIFPNFRQCICYPIL